MKMIAIFIITLSFLSCNADNKSRKNDETNIKSISCNTYGGMMGLSIQFKVTEDSLYYEYSTASDARKNVKSQKFNGKYQFTDIIKNNQIEGFSKIENGKSMLPIDGVDTEIIVQTGKRIDTVINGEKNMLFLQILMNLQSIEKREFGTN